MVAYLCSYLLGGDKKIHINTFVNRENERQEFWTKLDVPGKRLDKIPVYVLTAKKTFSAAEEFPYDLKTMHRATIVGEQTGGGANPGGFVPVDDHFAIFIPVARAENPFTKTNWEGIRRGA